MKKILFLLLLSIASYGQTPTGQEQEFDYGIKNNAAPTVAVPNYLTTQGMTGVYGKIEPINLPLSTAALDSLATKATNTLSGIVAALGYTPENVANKQNSLAVDGTGVKYATVDAVNYGLNATTPNRGLILGDSTMADDSLWDSVSSMLVLPKDIATGNTINDVSSSGSTLAGQKSQWVALSDKLTYDYIIVQIGLNDLGTEAEAVATVIARYQDLITTINTGRKAGSKLIIGTMTPCKQRFTDIYSPTNGVIAYDKWLALNEAIRGNGSSPITGVDARVDKHTQSLNDGFDNLAISYDVGDRIHPNNTGRKIYADAYREQLNIFNKLGVSSTANYTDYVQNGTFFKNTATFPNNTSGIGFNSFMESGTLKYIKEGCASFVNLTDSGYLRFFIAQNNPGGYGTSLLGTRTAMTINNAGVGINTESVIGSLTLHQSTNVNLTFDNSSIDATAIQLNAYNDAVSANIPMELKSSKLYLTGGNVLVNKSSDTGQKFQVDGSALVGAFESSLIHDNGTNVTIGTGTDPFKFTVFGGNALVKSGGSSTDAQLALKAVSDSSPYASVFGYRGDNGESAPLVLQELGNKVLIGTNTSASADLVQINGSISSTSFNGSATLTGTPTAPTATVGTNTTQIATTAFVQGIRPYKVYTALMSQTGTSAPTVKILENTIGSIVWTRINIGEYNGTLTSAFTADKSIVDLTSANQSTHLSGGASASTNFVAIFSQALVTGVLTDGVMLDSYVEIRVYN
jgi:lysophospholipase L1-like esterase